MPSRLAAASVVARCPDGSRASQPWMDNRYAYSRAGVPYRLTGGKAGVAIGVLPQATAYDHPVWRGRVPVQ
jgi:hypothetical protein